MLATVYQGQRKVILFFDEKGGVQIAGKKEPMPESLNGVAKVLPLLSENEGETISAAQNYFRFAASKREAEEGYGAWRQALLDAVTNHLPEYDPNGWTDEQKIPPTLTVCEDTGEYTPWLQISPRRGGKREGSWAAERVHVLALGYRVQRPEITPPRITLQNKAEGKKGKKDVTRFSIGVPVEFIQAGYRLWLEARNLEQRSKDVRSLLEEAYSRCGDFAVLVSENPPQLVAAFFVSSHPVSGGDVSPSLMVRWTPPKGKGVDDGS